ncbi:iron chaperone [Mucilaginibacter antarcticus]|uniref:Iron chaperone n=1 Tax=Mucilaginibacter antarcticus TaxID=1855725 RepID=A0ABW5XMJ3_9SPHI
MKGEPAKNIDEYIAGYPEDVQQLLQIIRTTIQQAAPDATETIGYGIPTFILNGNLVHFGGYKKHIGFYPAPMGIEAFAAETAQYETGKGTMQFQLDKPLPLDLITKIVKFRVEKNLEKAKKKK